MRKNLLLNDWGKITAIAVLVLIGWFIFLIFGSPLKSQTEVTIKEGQGLQEIAGVLRQNGVIKSKFVFLVYTIVIGNEKNLKAGRYIFKPGDNLLTVVHLIASGLAESEDILVTIPEGFNIWEIDQKFNQVGLIGKGGISRNFIHKEGHLFPDTYRFKKGTNPEGIVSKMEENYFKKGGTRSDEVIIIASLLEKEAKTKEDMELVAGIIYKRLKLGIPLQVDASVSYGWCLRNFEISVYPLRSRLSEASRNIGYCDVAQAPLALEIKIDGPYNTYIRLGLPPGAISNPGFVALEAAQNPKSSDYLYYLSTRDGNQIIYSKTASEHAANRKKYLGI